MRRRTTWLDLYAVVGALATVAAIRRSEPARLFGVRFPGTVAVQAATIGTGISAPLAALLFAPLVGRRGGSTSTALASAFLAGALGEPATWRALRRPSRDLSLTAIVLANLILPTLALTPRSSA